MERYIIGCEVLSAQAINISGGTKPKNVSEAKNTPKIAMGL